MIYNVAGDRSTHTSYLYNTHMCVECLYVERLEGVEKIGLEIFHLLQFCLSVL